MSKVIILDSGPLGLITNPKKSPESLACAQWLQNHLIVENRMIIPEISDYEVRRELLRPCPISNAIPPVLSIGISKPTPHWCSRSTEFRSLWYKVLRVISSCSIALNI